MEWIYEQQYCFDVTINRFRDGDTCEVHLDCRSCRGSHREAIRIPHIESWELRSADHDRALEAGRTLSERYRGARGILLTSKLRRDGHGRIVSDIALDGVALSLQLIEAGLAWPIDSTTPHADERRRQQEQQKNNG